MPSQPYPPHKIERPAARASDLPRPALAGALRHALTARRVVLLCAPAGFGKTTALASALGGLPADVATAWVEVDALDDLSRLSTCLLDALEPLDLPWRVSPESLIAALDGGRDAATAWAMALANALHGAAAARGVLALDALDRCEDPAVFAFVDALLKVWPRHWTLALTSRVEPPLALARWHVQQEVAEFRQDALRLVTDELATLWGGALAPDAAALRALQDLTQGWPAAATLLLHAQRRSPRAGAAMPALEGEGRRRLFAYLGSEVLDELPGELADFLLRCAVLPEWDAERCRTVTGCADAQRLLEDVQARGLFGRSLWRHGGAAGAAPAWAPDPLFLSFLDEQLQRRHPEERMALMRRAAASEPDATRRVDTLLRTGLADEAAGALLAGAPHWLGSGQASHLAHLLERFGPDQRDSAAWHMARALLAWLRWDWRTLEESAAQAERLHPRGDAPFGRIEARSLRALALTGMGDLDGAAKLLDEHADAQAGSPLQRLARASAHAWLACARGPRGAARPWQDQVTDLLIETDAPAWLWIQCAPNFRVVTMPGMGEAVSRFIGEALRKTAGESTPLRLLALALSAFQLVWRGDFDAAAVALDELTDEAQWTGMPRSLHWAVLTARLTLAGLGGPAYATSEDLAERLLADLPPGNPWRRSTLVHLARLAWAAADDPAWTRWTTQLRSAPQPTNEWPMVRGGVNLIEGLQALRHRDLAAAERSFEQASQVLRTCDANGLLDSVRVLMAWCLHRRGCEAEGAVWLHDGLRTMAEEGVCVGGLLAGAEVLRDLAPSVPPEGPMHAAWQRMQALLKPAARPAAAGRSVRPSKAPVLSARERDVLERVAAGDSNKVIARALDLSPHTVKRHMANILNKLGVATRGQAAVWFGARAHEDRRAG